MIDTLMLRKQVDESPCCFAGYKDSNYIFQYSNAEYAKVVGLKHPLDVVGRTAYDMPSRTAECAALFHAQDDKVIELKKHLNIFGIHPDVDDSFRAFNHVKAPLFDRSNNVIGVFFTSKNITSKATSELSLFLRKMPIITSGKILLDSGCYLIGKDHLEIDMSNREHEILFYLLRRKKAKYIAGLLSITPRTVYKHMESLRRKFNVRTSSELRDAASEMGLVDVLPPSIFNEKTSIYLNQR